MDAVQNINDLVLKRRVNVYVQEPHMYEIQCDKCNGINTTWSEWEGLIWCFDCEIDTTGTEGIFGGPIPYGAAVVLGMDFRKFCISTKQLLDIDTQDSKIIWRPANG